MAEVELFRAAEAMLCMLSPAWFGELPQMPAERWAHAWTSLMGQKASIEARALSHRMRAAQLIDSLRCWALPALLELGRGNRGGGCNSDCCSRPLLAEAAVTGPMGSHTSASSTMLSYATRRMPIDIVKACRVGEIMRSGHPQRGAAAQPQQWTNAGLAEG